MLIRLLATIGLLCTGKNLLSQVSSALHPQQENQEEAPLQGSDDEIIKDPVCLTYIPKSLAVRKIVNDKTWYFCSEKCAERFLEQQTES